VPTGDPYSARRSTACSKNYLPGVHHDILVGRLSNLDPKDEKTY